MSEQLTAGGEDVAESSGRAGRSTTRRTLVLVLAALLGYAVVGVVAGLVWESLWTPPAQTVQQHQLFFDDYSSLRRGFSGTGLYVVVALCASAVVGLVVSLFGRGRELVTLLVVAVGSILGAYLMWKVGVARGPADPTALAKTAADGTKVSGNLTLSGHSPYLVWPMTSLLVLVLVLLGWSGGRPRRASGQQTPSTGSETPVSPSAAE